MSWTEQMSRAAAIPELSLEAVQARQSGLKQLRSALPPDEYFETAMELAARAVDVNQGGTRFVAALEQARHAPEVEDQYRTGSESNLVEPDDENPVYPRQEVGLKVGRLLVTNGVLRTRADEYIDFDSAPKHINTSRNLDVRALLDSSLPEPVKAFAVGHTYQAFTGEIIKTKADNGATGIALSATPERSFAVIYAGPNTPPPKGKRPQRGVAPYLGFYDSFTEQLRVLDERLMGRFGSRAEQALMLALIAIRTQSIGSSNTNQITPTQLRADRINVLQNLSDGQLDKARDTLSSLKPVLDEPAQAFLA